MGWFDWYVPAAPIACPVCGQVLSEWQGKDGPCALLIWQQGSRGPIDQRVDTELRPTPWPLPIWSLPERFIFYSYDCGCRFPVEVWGYCEAGVWTRSEPITLATAQQQKHETRAQWSARRRWLSGKRN